jgi:cellulose synthase/poly-beta-1,6-N-acetylglucosamine synthase-like glycosyltransferase
MLPSSLAVLVNGQLVFLTTCMFVVSVGLILINVRPIKNPLFSYAYLLFAIVLSLSATLILVSNLTGAIIILFAFLGLLLVFFPLFPQLTIMGRSFLILMNLLVLSALIYGLWMIHVLPLSTFTRALMYLGFPLGLLSIPSFMLQKYELFEILLRTSWTRPHSTLPRRPPGYNPKVSLHVPSHAEPPEIVIATLNALSRLHYDNFEVLVIDNNTPDPALSQPIQDHCQKLGSHFKYYNLQNLKGAKAGALNFAIEQTDPHAEIVGVIDADYQADPEFINKLVGYFKDPKIGFIQTPHDYRDWQSNVYLTMCYWEYQVFFHTIMLSLNERHAGITVGTMCLVRKKALVDAGGWSTWCLTEDSELAIRIHALGYTSVYTTTPMGWGLIPDTLEGYKKQRFRWTVGPIQETKRHWRLILSAAPHSFFTSLMARAEHLNHGLYLIFTGLSTLLLPFSVAIILSMLFHREIIPIPFVLWYAITLGVVGSTLINFFLYMHVLRIGLKEVIGATLAQQALGFTILKACVAGLFGADFKWHRTDKFASLPQGLQSLLSCKTELIIGFTGLLLSTSILVIAPHHGLLVMLAVGIIFQSLSFLTSPLLALIADRQLRK